MPAEIEWVRGDKVGPLRDGERVRVQWPNRDALLTGRTVIEWREGNYHRESRSIVLDGGAVIAPPRRDGYEVQKSRPRQVHALNQEQPVLFEPPPVVPASAGRAELHDSLRPQKARKEKPRPIDYQFWAQVRVGDQVEVDGLHRGEVTESSVETEKVGDNTYVKNYAIVRLAGTGEELRVEDQTRMRRVQEGT